MKFILFILLTFFAFSTFSASESGFSSIYADSEVVELLDTKIEANICDGVKCPSGSECYEGICIATSPPCPSCID